MTADAVIKTLSNFCMLCRSYLSEYRTKVIKVVYCHEMMGGGITYKVVREFLMIRVYYGEGQGSMYLLSVEADVQERVPAVSLAGMVPFRCKYWGQQ